MAAKHTINLLPQDSFEQSSLGKFIKWSTTVGRWIVVFADLIVIGSFLSRFYFDTKLADYHDDIKEKQAILEATSQFETSFRALQKRLSLIKTLSAKKINGEAKAAFVSQVVPEGVTIENITIAADKITLSGISQDQTTIANLIKNLLLSPDVSGVNISQFIVGDKEHPSKINFSLFVSWRTT
jgi:hypothetical protein